MINHESQLRQEIVRIGQLMYQKGFVSASDGNISARLDSDRYLITPSGLHMGLLKPDELILIDGNGYAIGSRTYHNRQLKPTSEMPMHLEAYRQRPDITAVVHAHPPITIALTIAGIPLVDCLLPEVIVFLGLIPTTAYATPSSQESVSAIRALIVNHDAIVLQRHGSLTVGENLMQAFMRLETVEQNARIAFMLAQLGVYNPLPAEEIRKLLRQRKDLGLSHPGESAAFCEVCGVCHSGNDHAPTMPIPHHGKRSVDKLTNRPSAGPQSLPPIRNPALDNDAIRDLVAAIVQKTIGEPS